MTDQEKQAQAFYEGAAAATAKVEAFTNPHKDGALFDPLQLAEHWYEGHGYATRRARGKISRSRMKSAAHT
jgi:hypothetical protein